MYCYRLYSMEKREEAVVHVRLVTNRHVSYYSRGGKSNTKDIKKATTPKKIKIKHKWGGGGGGGAVTGTNDQLLSFGP